MKFFRKRKKHIINGESPFIVHEESRISKESFIGRYSYLGRCYSDGAIKIGKYCSVGNGVYLAPGEHPMCNLTTHPMIYGCSPFNEHQKIDFSFTGTPHFFNKCASERLKKDNCVTIKNDVWIGVNAILLQGITIGNGVVVGAGSIVTKDVPDYAIVAGNPAKILRYRFSEEEIKSLIELEWWNLEPCTLKDIDFSDIQHCIKTITQIKYTQSSE